MTFYERKLKENFKLGKAIDLGMKRLILLIVFISLFSSASAWWDAEWTYKQTLTLNTNGIGLSANVDNNHTILVNIKPSNTDFWANVDATGKDIRFVDSTDTIALDYHFEDFNYTAQDANIWVEINETFPSATDLEIQLYYGNAGATDAQNEAGTYPTSYTLVYHFPNAVGDYNDSTANNHDANTIVVNSRTARGKIGKAPDFVSGSGHKIHIPDSPVFSYTTTDPYTLYVWAKSDITGTTQDIMRHFRGGQGINQININDSDFARFFFRGTDEVSTIIDGTRDIADGAFHQIVGTRDIAQDLAILYTDGAHDANGTDNMSANMAIEDVFRIGIAQDDLSEAFDGIIDEVKIFNYTISPNEVKLLYNSETNNLISFGAQEEQPGTPNIPPVLTALTYPNAQGLVIVGTNDINFSFTDDDFSIASAYTYDITKINNDTTVETFIVNDGNAFSICDNMDSNLTTKICLFPFNFDTLGFDANYSIKVSVSDFNESNIITGQSFATQATPTFVFYDYFMDGDYTNDPTWTITDGGIGGTMGDFNAETTRLVVQGVGDQQFSHIFTAFPTNDDYDEIYFGYNFAPQNEGDEFSVGLSDNNYGSFQKAIELTEYGYWLYVGNDLTGVDAINLFQSFDNSTINYEELDVNTFNIGNNYDITTRRDIDGNWHIYIDGVEKGTPAINYDKNNFDTLGVEFYNAGDLTGGSVDNIFFDGNVIPPVLTPPDVNFTYSPLAPDTDDTITFTPQIVANGTLSVVMWSFEGDANVNYFTPITDENTQQTIIFSTSGTKTVCLTAGNEDGNTTQCRDVDVVDAPVPVSGYSAIYSILDIPFLIIDFIAGVLGVFVANAITVIGLIILGLILYIFSKIDFDKLTEWIK